VHQAALVLIRHFGEDTGKDNTQDLPQAEALLSYPTPEIRLQEFPRTSDMVAKQ